MTGAPGAFAAGGISSTDMMDTSSVTSPFESSIQSNTMDDSMSTDRGTSTLSLVERVNERRAARIGCMDATGTERERCVLGFRSENQNVSATDDESTIEDDTDDNTGIGTDATPDTQGTTTSDFQYTLNPDDLSTDDRNWIEQQCRNIFGADTAQCAPESLFAADMASTSDDQRHMMRMFFLWNYMMRQIRDTDTTGTMSINPSAYMEMLWPNGTTPAFPDTGTGGSMEDFQDMLEDLDTSSSTETTTTTTTDAGITNPTGDRPLTLGGYYTYPEDTFQNHAVYTAAWNECSELSSRSLTRCMDEYLQRNTTDTTDDATNTTDDTE
jgi:hypothetical protein